MTYLEIACVIIGFIGFLGCVPSKDTYHAIHWLIRICITRIISGCMILLPLYFNYWR